MALRDAIAAVCRDGRQRMVACPAHDDTEASVAVTLGDDGKVLLHDHGGCDTGAVLRAAGLDWKDLFSDNGRPKRKQTKRRIVATYDYEDEDGDLLYQVVRFEPKAFRQRRPDGDGWAWNLNGTRRVLYRLPELTDAEELWIVEGEKDVDRLRSLGFVATTCPGGTGKWRDEYADAFSDEQRVVVSPDNDDAGRKGARTIAANLHGNVASVKVLDLPDLPDKGDVSDFIDRFDHLEEAAERLAIMAEGAPEWEPEDAENLGAGADDREGPSEADLSHDSLALELGETRFDSARYVDPWNRWYFWQGSYWQKDESLLHMTRSREFLRDKADRLEEWAEDRAEEVDDDEADKIKRWAKRRADNLKAAHTVAAVVSLARSNEAQAESTDTWDRHHYLMGTTGRTLDLRTGKLREPRQDDYITKAAAVEPASAGTPTPLWDSFLERIMAGSAELIDYLQRLSGYSLTGSIEEHVFAFGHGGGANGKDTFIGTIQGILADYAQTIPVEALMVTRNARHPTEIARLRGVRLAVGSETERGKRWAESRIKSLTGGGRIAARFMRADYFEFDPTFKLFVHGNHKPSLYGVDEAIRRRLHLIPFTVTIPPAERDKKLRDKLEDEWPGIFRWCIEGCLEWQRRGLDPPPSVVEATDEYLHEEDTIGRWLDACCDTEDPQGFASSANLYESWKDWAEAAGEYVISQKRLSQELGERGFDSYRQPGGGSRGFIGLRLREDRQ